jgi:two-component system, chemotaxis family, chemotaxis protein CheY
MGVDPNNHRMDVLTEEYLVEYAEHLATIRADLLSITKGSGDIDPRELVNCVFRAVHSVRGASFLGLAKIGTLAQKMEDVVALIHSHQMVLTSYRIGVLLLATDRLQQLVQNSGTSNQADIGSIMAALERLHPNTEAAGDRSPASGPDQPVQDGRPLRMLVVEDDAASRILLKTFLSRFGDCDVAVNGREAVEAFRSTAARRLKYDLICIDIMMPEMDGREAVRQMRAMEEAEGTLPACGARIVMLTAVDDMKEVIESFQDFSDAYLIKPINLASLVRHMKSAHLVP